VKRVIFDLGAIYYDVVTARLAEWRADCGHLAAHFRDEDRVVVGLGTGPGVSAYEVAASNDRVLVLGLDISHAMLRRAVRNRRRYPASERRVQFIRADAEAVPLASGSVNVVITHSFLYLASNRRAVLDEVRRLLRPGGQVILLEPRRERPAVPALRTWLRRPGYAWTMFLWGVVSRLEGAFGEGELASLLQGAGLRVDQQTPALEGFGWLVVAHALLESTHQALDACVQVRSE
jgi:ubiquinone/menaquinone biosynthesis C-methylase UbiE